jgi:phage FluMu protein Com
MKTKKLIKLLKLCIAESIAHGDGENDASWENEQGILMCRGGANIFLKLLKKERDSKRMAKNIMKEITCEECGGVLEFNEVGEKKCPKCEKHKKYRHDALMAFNKQAEAYYKKYAGYVFDAFKGVYQEDGSPLCYCGDCKEAMTLVRPGKHQCDNPICKSNGGL